MSIVFVLSECSQPRDQRRIAKNRREFQANNNSLSSARYSFKKSL